MAWVEVGPGTRQELRLSASLDTKSVEVEMKPTGTEQEITIGYRGHLGKVLLRTEVRELD
ncbi:MAG: hypothetical protein FJ405_18720 [Verrucomicrobia bacterium]|nr:hypothetical protein [Verrucomicrobiota bacterium]